MRPLVLFPIVLILVWVAGPVQAQPRYAWSPSLPAADTLQARFAPPPGFRRVPAEAGSWSEWLRQLPLNPPGSPVLLYTGAPKGRQDVHAGVVAIDVGKRDLQQCADAVMRLRAEWQFASGRIDEIGFNYTDGKRRNFTRASRKDYPGFRKYMDQVFAYAGTYSLERELKPAKVEDIRAGDVFIKGGFPGHAVLVADVVESAAGERRFLLLQSYMPAQEIHVLKNPSTDDGSAWYGADFGPVLVTPEWTFSRDQLRRWP